MRRCATQRDTPPSLPRYTPPTQSPAALRSPEVRISRQVAVSEAGRRSGGCVVGALHGSGEVRVGLTTALRERRSLSTLFRARGVRRGENMRAQDLRQRQQLFGPIPNRYSLRPVSRPLSPEAHAQFCQRRASRRLRVLETRWSRSHEERDHKHFNVKLSVLPRTPLSPEAHVACTGDVRHEQRVQESPARRRHEEQVALCGLGARHASAREVLPYGTPPS